MNIKTIVSRQWTLGIRDRLKSLYYAVIVPVLLQVQSVLDSGTLNFDWILLAQVALSAAVAHVIRKLTEPTKVVTVQEIPKEKVPEAEILAKRANIEKDVPPPIQDPTHPIRLFSEEGFPQDPPPNQDPTHPPKKP